VYLSCFCFSMAFLLYNTLCINYADLLAGLTSGSLFFLFLQLEIKVPYGYPVLYRASVTVVGLCSYLLITYQTSIHRDGIRTFGGR
jgi:hypothetical protein